MENFPKTQRNTVHRLPKRAAYDRETIYSILDASLVCHVAFVQDEQPFLIPTLHARLNDKLLLHGSTNSRLMKHIQTGSPITVAVTLLDGLVLARAVFDHSVNYRSAILFCRGKLIEEPKLKLDALRIFTERLIPGRWDDVRPPNENEIKATSIANLEIESASAKIREGMPVDSEEDMKLPVWAGTIPIFQAYGIPQQDMTTIMTLPLPGYLDEMLKDLKKPS